MFSIPRQLASVCMDFEVKFQVAAHIGMDCMGCSTDTLDETDTTLNAGQNSERVFERELFRKLFHF